MVRYHRGLTSNRCLTFECEEKNTIYKDPSERCATCNGWSYYNNLTLTPGFGVYMLYKIMFQQSVADIWSSFEVTSSPTPVLTALIMWRYGQVAQRLSIKADSTFSVSMIHGSCRPQCTLSQRLGCRPFPSPHPTAGSVHTRNKPLSGLLWYTVN